LASRPQRCAGVLRNQRGNSCAPRARANHTNRCPHTSHATRFDRP
jgi:hypothetical protein